MTKTFLFIYYVINSVRRACAFIIFILFLTILLIQFVVFSSDF